MKIEHLTSFRMIAKTGSFTKAAQQLFVTQPTITNHIQTLERELGCSLLIRSNQHTRLTPEGEELAQRLDEFFQQMEDIRSIGKRRGTVAGDLVLAASSVMGTYFLPPILKSIAEKYHDINIHLHFGNSYRIAIWVQEGFIDIGFAPWVPGFPSICFHPARSEPCVIVAAASYFQQNRKKLEAGDFSKATFILREKGTKIHDMAMGWIRKYPGPMNARSPIIMCDMESVKHMLLCGAGVSILPLCCVAQELERGTMHTIPSTVPIPPMEYYVLHRRNEPFKPIHSPLLTELEERYQITPTCDED